MGDGAQFTAASVVAVAPFCSVLETAFELYARGVLVTFSAENVAFRDFGGSSL